MMNNNCYIKELLLQFSSMPRDAIALSCYDGTAVTDFTYEKFTSDILCAAGYFRDQHIRDQHIALVAPNSYNWLVAFFAITASGNVAVMLNPVTPADWPSQIAFADVSIICGNCTSLETLPANSIDVRRLTYDHLRSVHPFTTEDIVCPSPETTSILMFTSGTTGKSKVVEFSYENMWHSMDFQEEAYATPGASRFLLVLPMSHIGGIRCAISMLRKKMVLCVGRGPKYLFADLPILNPSCVSMVPAMMESLVKILKQCDTDEKRRQIIGYNLNTISYGGAYVKPSVCRDLTNLGIIIEVGYGMTETTGVGTWGKWDEAHSTSVGKAYGNFECRVQDGEILIKGPFVIKGYYKDPKETAKITDNGWIHTGDMGHFDSDGFLYITGRKKNVIILSNGENVNPEEIEEILYSCSAVLECIVYGSPKGICADFYAQDQETITEYVRQYNAGVPLYRQIYKSNFSPIPLERTPSGKLKRKENKFE